MIVRGSKYLRHAGFDQHDHNSLEHDISAKVIALVKNHGNGHNEFELPPDTPEELRGIMSMVLKAASNSSADPGGITDLKATISAMINDDLKPRVMDDWQALQTQIKDFLNLFNGCEASRASGMNSSLVHQEAIPGLVKQHRECRNLEASMKEKVESKTAQTTEAATSQQTACASTSTVPDYTTCSSSHGESASSYYRRMIAIFKEQAQAVTTRKEACTNITETVTEMKNATITANADWTKQREICNQLQNSLDAESCDLSLIMEETCTKYKTCRSQSEMSFNLITNSGKDKEKSFQQQWWTLNLINCILDAVGSPNAIELLEDCQTRDFSAGEYSLYYPTAPDCEACERLVERPGTEEYEAVVFANISSLSMPKPCTASCCLDTSVAEIAPEEEEAPTMLRVASEVPSISPADMALVSMKSKLRSAF